MIKIKEKIYYIIKSILTVIVLLTIILFFYSAFFYKNPVADKESAENQIVKEEEILRLEKKIEKKISEMEKEKVRETKKKNEIQQIKTTIKDGLFATVGDQVITKSDILNEIKIILILNNLSYSEDKKEQLQQMAIKSAVKRIVKEIEIDKQPFLEFNEDDLKKELLKITNRINIDIPTLKNICKANGLDFSIIKDQIKTDLLWNSLIFLAYRDKISINLEEINEQLKLNQNKKEFKEYFISEILIEPVENAKLKSTIEEIKRKIEIEGFKSVAMNLSIAKSSVNGGDLGWVDETKMAKKFRSVISNTPIGSLSEPMVLKEGILIFKVKNKKKIEKKIDLEELKNQLVNSEKQKILNMYSMSHYDNLRRTVTIKYF